MPESANRTGHALPPGAKTLRFRFNGKTYTGLQGTPLLLPCWPTAFTLWAAVLNITAPGDFQRRQ